ncbi:hypothetical protein [Neisseria weaveri]|uniref:hypothetical protein n=1 Tax=Neisseria weaveri TaxID=28091 RepID=UPI000D2F6ED9|nr:hypothetical protein [Neisseria weaveri]
MKLTGWVCLALLGLTACAVTPEQKMAREALALRQQQDLQVALAAQCDTETARLLRDHFDGNTGAAEKERQAFRSKYVDKTSDSMFQACYRMAWQNYISQQQLEQAYRWRYWDDGYHPWFYRPWYRW